MLFLNVATMLKAPLLGLLGSFAATGPAGAPDTDGALTPPAEVTAIETLYWEEDFPRGGGLDGINEEFETGPECGGLLRTRAEALVVAGKANCAVVGWVADDPKDCRVRVHIDIDAFGWAVCRVQVYVDK